MALAKKDQIKEDIELTPLNGTKVRDLKVHLLRAERQDGLGNLRISLIPAK